MKKKILLFLLVSSLFIILSSCRMPTEKDFDHGGYLAYREFSDGTIEVVGLTELGKQQEIIVVPRTINGKKVVNVELYRGGTIGWGTYPITSFGSKTLKKVYILTNTIDEALFIDSYDLDWFPNKTSIAMNLEKVISMNHCYFDNLKEPFGIYYPSMMEDYTAHIGTDYNYNQYFVNVLYHYNYEDENNDKYYFIDDYENEVITYIPDNPKREGYLFGGWFKEEECINLFDFGKEIIPQKVYYQVEKDERTYNLPITTNLYARWIKQNNK